MGGCCSKPPGTQVQLGLSERDNVAALIRTENMTAETMRKIVGPPAPLLKEITFAPILDNGTDDLEEEESTEKAEEDHKSK
jgi:hypothetical protein